MSRDDQVISTGKTVLEYIESKRKLATIRIEVARMAEQLEAGARALRENAGDQAAINTFIGMPTYDGLRTLLDDLHLETSRYNSLVIALNGIGLEV